MLELTASCLLWSRRHLQDRPHVSRPVTFRCSVPGTIVIFELCFTLLGLALRTRCLRLATAGVVYAIENASTAVSVAHGLRPVISARAIIVLHE